MITKIWRFLKPVTSCHNLNFAIIADN